MSLPAFLYNRYRQYKNDTDSFTTWLRHAAQECGWKSPATAPAQALQKTEVTTAPSQRLKGKARKLAKESASNKVPQSANPRIEPVRRGTTTKELLDQAKAVAESTVKRITLPRRIRSFVERAISARKRCAALFAEAGASDTANEKHQYFIKVLQNALDLLTKSRLDATPGAKEERAVQPDKIENFRYVRSFPYVLVETGCID